MARSPPLSNTHTHTHNLCPGRPGWAAGTTRSIHPFTPNRSLSTSSIYYDPQHPPCPIYVLGSPFSQPLFRSSVCSWSATLYLISIHFFAQSYHLPFATHAHTVAASFAVYSTNVISSILSIHSILFFLFRRCRTRGYIGSQVDLFLRLCDGSYRAFHLSRRRYVPRPRTRWRQCIGHGLARRS